jgi:hypothetical protein
VASVVGCTDDACCAARVAPDGQRLSGVITRKYPFRVAIGAAMKLA